MRRALSVLLPIIIIAVALLLASWLILSRPAAEPLEVEPYRPLVQVIEADPHGHRFLVEARGTVEPLREIALVPEVGGRIVAISERLAEGAFFDEGEILVTIDAGDLERAVVIARGRVAGAELALAREEAEAEVARSEWADLGRAEAPPLVVRAPQVAAARAELAAARAALEQAERDVERTRVAAPFAGRVRSKRIDSGELVARGQVLAVIYAADRCEVRLPVPDRELAFLDLPLDDGRERLADAPIEVRLSARFGGELHEWRGAVTRIGGEIDPLSRMVALIAEVEDPFGRRAEPGDRRPPLAPGLFVDARILGREAEQVLLLPRAALRDGARVLVVDDDERIRFREVEILRRERDRVVIGSGIPAGARVVVTPLELVVEGMPVRIAAPPSTGAGSSGREGAH